MNTIVLSGTINSTPELRYLENGTAITYFVLSFTNASKSGSTKQINCISFGKLAEVVAQFHEGESVVLIGAINITTVERDGIKSRKTELKISSIDVTETPVNVNSVSLAGRTGKDPETRYFESGTNKSSVSLAVRRTSDQTDWFDVEAWGKTGEVMGNYVRKGGLIGVQGQLKFEEWNDRTTGELRSKPVINVTQLDLLGSKKEESNDYGF